MIRTRSFRAAKDAHRAADYLLALEREKLVEITSDPPDITHRRETTEYVAKFEPDADSVAIQQKATAKEQRLPSHADHGNSEPLAEPKRVTESVLDNEVRQFSRSSRELVGSFASAQDLARRHLGDDARTYVAQTDSGVYRGEVVAETDFHVVQRLSGNSAVAHMKHLLSAVPAVGDSVVVRYSNDSARVTDLPAKARSREIGR